VVGGLEDWVVNMVVCDIMGPFTLTSPGIGVAEFSGGLSGTYFAQGVFNFTYEGTYQITLSNGIGSPGSMDACRALQRLTYIAALNRRVPVSPATLAQ
jgi:hypothetical protein